MIYYHVKINSKFLIRVIFESIYFFLYSKLIYLVYIQRKEFIRMKFNLFYIYRFIYIVHIIFFSSDNAKGLQPNVVASQRFLEVYGQFLVIAIGRTVVKPVGIRTEKKQAKHTCRGTCRPFTLLCNSWRHLGLYFEVSDCIYYNASIRQD